MTGTMERWRHEGNPNSGTDPAMGWSVKGNSVVNLFFSFFRFLLLSYVAFWIVSSGRAPA